MLGTRFFKHSTALVLLSLALATFARADDTLEALQAEYHALFQLAAKSVVAVRADSGTRADSEVIAPAGLTTRSHSLAGFVVEGGLVVTYAGAPSSDSNDGSERFIKSKRLTIQTASGLAAVCEVVGTDLRNLLVVARLPANWNLPALPLLDTQLPPTGSTVAAIGNSFDSIMIDGTPSMALGSLSDSYRLTRTNPYQLGARPTLYRGNLVEFEGAVNPGDAGGPLLDMEGRVIGMMTPLVNFGRQQGTAVPVSQLKMAIEALRKGEVLPQPRLGFSVTAHRQAGANGKRVTEVTPESAAEVAGLKVDDIILAIDGETFEPDELIGELIGWGTWTDRETKEKQSSGTTSYGLPPGAQINLLVMREMAYYSLALRAGGLPPLRPYQSSSKLLSQRSALERAALSQVAAESVVSVSIMRNTRAGTNKRMGVRQAFLDLTIGPNTGVVVGSDGEILICDSILGPFVGKERQGKPGTIDHIYVTLANGRSYRAVIHGRDRASDLALLKIPARNLKPIDFSRPNAAAGTTLHTLARSYSHLTLGSRRGIVSATDRNNGREFQLDAKIGAADLGSLIVDTSGAALGVVTNFDIATVGQASGVAFASHNSTVLRALESLRRGEFTSVPPTPFLGVIASAIFVDKPGLKVASVTPSSGAALAGVLENDVLLKADGVDLYDIGDLRRVISQRRVNDTMTLIVERTNSNGESETKELVAVLGSRE